MNKILRKKLSSEHIRKARKAAYWQEGYDEWKKHGAIYPSLNISELINDDLLQEYMDNGWNTITDVYKSSIINDLSNKNIKINNNNVLLNNFNSNSIDKQELVLGILGSIRKYMVKTIFKCIQDNLKCEKMNEISFSGSTNITSDFDISILGPNGNLIMWRMFVTFLAKYGDSLPDAFDTNLYSSPMYIHKSNDYTNIICKSKDIFIQRVDFNNRFFTLVPFTKEDIDIELNWAFIKLLGRNIKIHDNLIKYFYNACKYKEAMDNLEEEICKDKTYLEISLQNNLHPSNTINKDTKYLIKRYYLQYIWQKKIHKYIYSSDTNNCDFKRKKIYLRDSLIAETNIFFYSNIVNYFSSDAYYTSSSVNAIVIEDQKNIQLYLSNRSKEIIYKMYIVAAVENLGDMINHINKNFKKLESNNRVTINNIKIILIKNSKYLFRIYKCLGKVDEKYTYLAMNIFDNVLQFRGNYNIFEANQQNIFKYLYYNNEKNINTYLNNIQKIVLSEINELFYLFEK
jgi:hypothetical protein